MVLNPTCGENSLALDLGNLDLLNVENCSYFYVDMYTVHRVILLYLQNCQNSLFRSSELYIETSETRNYFSLLYGFKSHLW